ncbi:MAG: glycoside hydrolase TIM-barrel-like domain-containing protein [Rhodobacteraceae bacterium]|nr:glycoside hydrolase TIM-barrel-like domain-containing protein [Paracoccaceae bacterium]
MATILLSAAGAALGAGFGGTVLGLSGAVIGRAAGAAFGRLIDQRIMGTGSEAVETGRMDRFQIMGAGYGAPIARCWGRVRLPGQVIWASPFTKITATSGGGKGARRPSVTSYSYVVSLALALCEGEILGIGRIWADGDEIAPKKLNLSVYTGTEDQLPDPVLAAHLGLEHTPSYRGIAYVVIENLELSSFGNRVPQLSFEVMRRGQGSEAETIPDFQDCIRGVALIPGTGEYSLATERVSQTDEFGLSRPVNVNSPSDEPDLVTSLAQLRRELPNCGAVSLVVSWFGNDLRCTNCEVRPKVEAAAAESHQMPWRAGGIGRTQALEVPRRDGQSIYGGTPADASVIQAIKAIRDGGQSVMFYPFVMMDQLAGNALPNPYSDIDEQPIMPWRGRITLPIAPGRAGTIDGTLEAELAVAKFFGEAAVSDFVEVGEEIHYTGPDDWGFRRFILHYAHLCRMAGGVDAFCIGSELRGITQIRGANRSFPAVNALIELAADVRSILGDETKISYAADWSEYFGFHRDGNVFFHLDPLWANKNIDFVGIDNYMPLSDWRDGPLNLDAEWGSIYSIDYLLSNVCGGEGYDWFYGSEDARTKQQRTPIEDTEHGEDWVFRYKDLSSWWSQQHYNRIDGVRQETPTNWIPASKPLRFTEYGCAAVDNASNEPNKFVDNYSSESSLPFGSNGARDDFIQLQYYSAIQQYWSDPKNNPVSEIYRASMVDLSNSYAWAWDARPYPDFPRNSTLWADGLNYHAGHWLNGRSTSSPLGRVIAEIGQSSEVVNNDQSRLYGLTYGYIVRPEQFPCR